MRLYFPESFEFVILNSGVFKVEDDALKRTYDFADSVKFLSWERYYTYLLWKVSNKEYGKSQKSLPRFLESKRNVEKIYSSIGEIVR